MAEENKGLPVHGYTSQSNELVKIVNENKIAEEELLRRLDKLADQSRGDRLGLPNHDPRWLAIARTHFEQGFMAMNRAVFQPKRINLPTD